MCLKGDRSFFSPVLLRGLAKTDAVTASYRFNRLALLARVYFSENAVGSESNLQAYGKDRRAAERSPGRDVDLHPRVFNVSRAFRDRSGYISRAIPGDLRRTGRFAWYFVGPVLAPACSGGLRRHVASDGPTVSRDLFCSFRQSCAEYLSLFDPFRPRQPSGMQLIFKLPTDRARTYPARPMLFKTADLGAVRIHEYIEREGLRQIIGS